MTTLPPQLPDPQPPDPQLPDPQLPDPQLPDPGRGHWVRVGTARAHRRGSRAWPPGPLRDATRAGRVALAASAPLALYVALTAVLGHPPGGSTGEPDLAGEWVLLPAWLCGGYWLSLLNRTARLRAPQHSAPFCWVAWVIPFVMLFLPKRILDDAWAATAGLEPRAVRRRTRLWWALWLLFLLVAAPLAHDWDWALTALVGDHAGTASWYLRGASVGLTLAAYAAWADVVRRASAVQAGRNSPDQPHGTTPQRQNSSTFPAED